ncbi:testicular acid phosphatase homolog [Ambystoma mexicanum]|uniref:testicular acid phosphatase homolog n=1 Tax=Ambystoma mexicanum TaxID=8296 RepID=UPI0037E93117
MHRSRPHCVLLLTLLTLAGAPLAVQARTLRMVTLLYRHGDRAPIDTYPKDPHKDAAWPGGLQQLTQEGMRQQYELGQYLRSRYQDFLSSSYRRQEIYVRSTDYDRTLMSAQANLAGLYPPNSSELWNPEIKWQPIPIHTVPVSQDRLLKFPMKDCPRYHELMEETVQLPQYQDKMDAWKDFIKEIANHTGYSVEGTGPRRAWKVYDTLFCQKTHNLSLPEWATPQVMATLEEISTFEVMSHVGFHKLNEKARLTGGILVDAVLRNFSEVLRRSLPLKMIMYSAHDSTIIALQGALRVFNGRHPPYAACHIFEFYQETDGSYSVSMLYRNTSSSAPYQLVLPGCSASCPLHRFIELTAPVIPEDWGKECHRKDNSSPATERAIIALSALSGLLVLATVTLAVLYGRLRKRYRTM